VIEVDQPGLLSMPVMLSRTVASAWSARARTRLFRVVDRIFAIVLEIEPCVTRGMLVMSDCLPKSALHVLTEPPATGWPHWAA
jgi:hypothetical protein